MRHQLFKETMITKTKMDYIHRLFDECISEDGDSLEMKSKFIKDDGLDVLMQVDRPLEKIENLDLIKNHLTHKGIHFLAKCPRLENLKRLYIGDNNMGDKGAAVFAQAPFIPNLVHLDLRFNNIGVDGGVALVNGPFKKIQVFILQDNPTGDETLMALAVQPGFVNIRKLNVYRTDLSDLGIKTLAKSKVLKKLRHLNLARNIIRVDAALALARTKTLTEIETLLMFDTFIGDKGVEALLTSESLSKLKTLRLT